jgi:methyl-accepting chemotaxis protein
VADEVRALARKSQTATTSIERQLGRLRQTIEEATGGMIELSERATESQRAAEAVQVCLDEITEHVGGIVTRNAEVAQGADDQRQEAGGITHGLGQITDHARVAEAGVERSAEVAGRLGDQLRAMRGALELFTVADEGPSNGTALDWSGAAGAPSLGPHRPALEADAA